MKPMKIFLALLAAVLFTACGDDNGPGDEPGKIEVPNAQELTQTLEAGATTGSVTFTTDGAWSSTIAETRAEAPGWISISPDHGDKAGTYTLEIALTPNDTEAARTATVTIRCGETFIEIKVAQQPAGQQEPDPTPGPDPQPTAGNRIVRIDWYNLDDPAKPELEFVNLFTYDAQGRLTRCEERPTADAAPNRYHTLTYGDGTVQHGYFTTEKMPDGTYDEEEHDTVTPDAAGRWAQWTNTAFGETNAYTATYTDGRITERRSERADGSDGYTYVWEAGNLIRMEETVTKDAGSNVHLFEYTTTANPFETAIVDPVWLNTHVEYYDDLALGFYGTHSRNRLKSIKLYDDYACTDLLEQTTFEYELDAAGRIVRVDIVNTDGEDDLEIREYGIFTYAE